MPDDDHRSQERELVRKCLAGDPEAWEEFAAACAPVVGRAVRKTLRRFGRAGDSALEQDVTQDALAFLVDPQRTPLRAFRWECSLPYYVSVAAVQRTLLGLRREGRECDRVRLLPLFRDLDLGPQAPDAELERTESERKVHQALEQLGDQERLAIQLTYWDSLPTDQAARILGVSKESIWQILSKARKRLTVLLNSLRCLML